jgi:hypothetical protein
MFVTTLEEFYDNYTVQIAAIIIPGIDSVIIFDNGAYHISPETFWDTKFSFFSSYQALILFPYFYSIL